MADCRIIEVFEEHFVHVYPLFVHVSCRLGIPLPCQSVPHRPEIDNIRAE
nr:MAG TPA: hypothetical protein [Caudoviricetes sp.]DAV13751.1 MAG TPA: hypothetical protein [Caudoviricetes sp.]